MSKDKWVILGLLALVGLFTYVLSQYAESIFSYSGPVARLLFVLIVITEVILAPVPGGAIAFVAAAQFGMAWSWPLQYIGNIIGAVIVFYLARTFGRPYIEKMTSVSDREKYSRMLINHPVRLWLVYAIPVFPIDIVSIVAGTSQLSFRQFIFTISTGLVFYTGITAFVGSRLGEHIPYLNTISLVILVGFVVALLYFLLRWKKAR